ncbi:MAG: hypothetical protein R3E66_11525 [bacterium]
MERAWPEGTQAQRRAVFDNDQPATSGFAATATNRARFDITVVVPTGEEPFGLPGLLGFGAG